MAMLTQQDSSALYSALALHAAFIGLAWLASVWVFPKSETASQGEPVQATLAISSKDQARAREAIRAAMVQPQPKPEPRPQTSTQPLQQTAQDWVDQPDLETQVAVDRLGALPSELTAEQIRKQKQAQIELTEDVRKAQDAENRQRLMQQQLADVKQQRALLSQQIEAQKLDALANAGKAAPVKAPERPVGLSGSAGTATGKYLSAINATARANWNTVQIPAQTRCQVEFTQIRGGEVIDVAFKACGLDLAGKESIERALFKTPMPYAGFEAVFQRKVILTFCYPDEVCQ
jgi:colicin import membrane protein